MLQPHQVTIFEVWGKSNKYFGGMCSVPVIQMSKTNAIPIDSNKHAIRYLKPVIVLSGRLFI
jgi:hypothetical protein